MRTGAAPIPLFNLEIVTDASPWGWGGYLEAVGQNTILQYFSSPLDSLDTDRFGVEIGSPDGQQYWEALSILVALRLWGKFFADCQATLQIRGDSVTALTLASKLSSSSSKLNSIGAEISLDLEILNISDVFASHTPGKLLVCADYLSRVHEPNVNVEMPSELSSAKRKEVPLRAESFYRVWSISS